MNALTNEKVISSSPPPLEQDISMNHGLNQKDNESYECTLIEMYFEVTKGEDRVPRNGWNSIQSHFRRITKSNANLLHIQNTIRKVLKMGKYSNFVEDCKNRYKDNSSSRPLSNQMETDVNFISPTESPNMQQGTYRELYYILIYHQIF